jgi:hypothetical protein
VWFRPYPARSRRLLDLLRRPSPARYAPGSAAEGGQGVTDSLRDVGQRPTATSLRGLGRSHRAAYKKKLDKDEEIKRARWKLILILRFLDFSLFSLGHVTDVLRRKI